MRLIYTKTGAEVKVGDVVETSRGETVTVDYFREPHKPSSSGKIIVRHHDETVEDRGTAQYYVGVIGAEWIEREDQADFYEAHAAPDGSPMCMADGKNAWRKMDEEQRAEILEWIRNAPDAPTTNAGLRIKGTR